MGDGTNRKFYKYFFVYFIKNTTFYENLVISGFEVCNIHVEGLVIFFGNFEEIIFHTNQFSDSCEIYTHSYVQLQNTYF